jgi:peptidoglycan/xylan/chitin deacetylase (PgdA/CDA1 family)
VRAVESTPLAVKPPLLFVLALLLPCAAAAAPPHELHQRLDTSNPAHARDVALTLDACGGAYDRDLIATLVRLKVPATIFVTRRWLDGNPAAMRELLAHPELFEIENHGSAHVPAVVGGNVFGLHGPRDVAGVEREIAGGAQAVSRAASQPPHWYRGAGAAYDAQGEQCISRLGFQIAGFSLNADDGATLGAAAVARRLRRVQPGDIVIAHMNKPASGTAEGIAAVLPELLARQIRFVKLSQAAGVKPVR